MFFKIILYIYIYILFQPFQSQEFYFKFWTSTSCYNGVLRLILEMNWEVVKCAEPSSFPTEPKERHNTHICFN
jgi:hypothetical protein